MLTKGMDREKAQMFLQQSIAQMCKVTVSFTGPIEIDGIICITGHHKDDLVLVRLHEKSTSPEVPDCDTGGTDRQDDTSVTTHDLSMSTDAVTSVGYPHENLSENTICSSDDASCGHIRQLDSTSGVSGDRTWRYSKQFGDTCRSGNESCDYSTQVGDDVTGPEKRTEADTEHLNFVGTDDKIKTELTALDSDYENCIDEDVTDKSESCLHVDSSCSTIKKLSSDDFNPTKPDSKVMNHDEGGPCTVSHATRAMEFDESLLDLVSATRGVVSRVSGGQSASQSACMRCSHCRDEFSTSSLLSMHMLNAHGVYACEHCQRCFMHHSSLHRHKHVHRDTLPWVCTLCQRGFQRKEHLSYHISCHNNMKLHQCGECGKGFKLRARLHMHLDHVHAGRTQHLCKPCFMEFTNNATFTQHQKRHNDGSVSYLCGQCGYIGENRPSLIKHSVIHFGHKVDV